jgi:hypothetical protein
MASMHLHQQPCSGKRILWSVTFIRIVQCEQNVKAAALVTAVVSVGLA